MVQYLAFALVLSSVRFSTAELVVNKAGMANTFDGIGELSTVVLKWVYLHIKVSAGSV